MPAQHTHDLVGIGFGPSNIALAIAIEDHNRTRPASEHIDAVFVDARPTFAWHPGMMLPGATMQIAFPKDLVTFRDPRSRFTFFNYLHESGRLVDFVNRKTFFPTRVEFADYLRWAAETVDAEVHWATRIAGIDVTDGGPAVVRSEDGREFRTRAVAMAPGLSPALPEGVTTDDRIFHNAEILSSLASLPSTPLGRLAVLGAGQSAAEVAAHLHESHPACEVHLVHSRFGLSPSDDTPFANRVFDPATVDRWFGADPGARQKMLDYHLNTNYSAVDEELIVDLYEREYAEKVSGNRRLFIHNCTTVDRIHRDGDGVVLTTSDVMSGAKADLHVDALVCATGFRHRAIDDLLPAGLVARDADGEPIIERDHRVRLVDRGDHEMPVFYLNGGAQHTHGLGSILLSTIAVRAGEILASLTHRTSAVTA